MGFVVIGILIIITFILVSVILTRVGLALLRSAKQRPEDAPVPVARTANPHGAERVVRGATRLGRGVRRVVGIALILAPWATIAALFSALASSSSGPHESNSKGRVLRIKNRARLPELAIGAGWAAPEIALGVTLSATERAVLGELWLLTARMEHASIAAFSQLSMQLSALGAPARLLAAAHRAALEEIRHAEHCFAIASAITGKLQCAGPIAELAVASSGGGAIDVTRLAIGSLVDGCLAEGIASDVAGRGASTAQEAVIRTTLSMIAREELGHAEIAWDVLAWCLDRGGAPVHAAVHARVEALARELVPRLPDIPGLDNATLARHGVIDQDALGELASSRVAAVQQRARTLLQGRAQLRAAA